MKNKVTLFWFRRDLRLEDNMGLSKALSSPYPVLPIFIFDTTILEELDDKKDRRVDFIHQSLSVINIQLKAYGSKLNTYFGNPLEIFENLCETHDVQMAFCNRDYEPQAIARDAEISRLFETLNIPFYTFKDQVVFDKTDILKKDGSPYTIYTPYAKAWKERLTPIDYQAALCPLDKFIKQPFSEIMLLNDIGFQKTDLSFKPPELNENLISKYHTYRDYPAIEGTTQLGIALRFGTISIRKCVAFALVHNQTWLSELIWREFFMQILYHFPNVVSQSFKKEYDNIAWQNNESDFELWCTGKTGYPLVDAGMRQLNKTGYMHNRVRMVVASFLCKHLLIDWRWGEAYFAQKLNDYDLSANNGNWQWAAGCGCDAAPYFRVFNPHIQIEKFDKNLDYTKQWVLELETTHYPKPMVEHASARDRAIEVYKKALEANKGL